MKVKQVRRLYHQFGHLFTRPRLSGDEIGEALAKAGLIEWVELGENERPMRYRETDAMRAIKGNKTALEIAVSALVEKYFNITKP